MKKVKDRVEQEYCGQRGEDIALTLTGIAFRLLIVGRQSGRSSIVGTRLISVGMVPLTSSTWVFRSVGHLLQDNID